MATTSLSTIIGDQIEKFSQPARPIYRIEFIKTVDVVFCCVACDKLVVRDSREHDECVCDVDGEWFCGDCGLSEYPCSDCGVSDDDESEHDGETKVEE